MPLNPHIVLTALFIGLSLLCTNTLNAQHTVEETSKGWAILIDGETPKRKFIRDLIKNQDDIIIAQDYMIRHDRLRRTGNGFLIASAPTVVGGFAIAYFSENLGQALMSVAILYFGGMFLITSGILHIIADQRYRKAYNYYIRSYIEMNAGLTHSGLRFSIDLF